MSRLVVVSNRVAVARETRAGGLAVALHSALNERGGLWFGWSGRLSKHASGALHEAQDGKISYVTMDLSREDYDLYYNGFANRTLWPLLHFRIDLVDYSRATWAGYQRVNLLFAERLAALLRPDDLLWIHDYHLIPLAAYLRERGVSSRIGFFLHVPMPSADLLAALPAHAQVFGTLGAYDLVGFQTQRDMERFQDYMRLEAGGKVLTQGKLQARDGRRFYAGAFPISIDTETIARQAASAARNLVVQRLHGSLVGKQLAIGVDRLDYSKGLPERFRAFQRYLELHSDQRGKVSFLQIAPASRADVPEYMQLRSELEQLSGHINGAFADPEWTPIRYVNRSYPHATLTGFLRLARIGFVTPLRDGMNLVAKEFIASQDPSDPGVLVLSRFAGAARELREALLVNPFDLDGVAEALRTAATMPLEERVARWEKMMSWLCSNDIHAWRRRYLDALVASGAS